MDSLGHAVKVVAQPGAGQVRDGDAHTLHARVGGADVVERGVDDQRDALLRDQRSIARGLSPAQEESGRDLREGHHASLRGNTHGF